MKNHTLLLLCLLLLASCSGSIKNDQAKVDVEKGTEVVTPEKTEAAKEVPSKAPENVAVNQEQDLLGFWVGYFKADDDRGNGNKTIYVDEGYNWNRENKINISIDKIAEDQVVGHSVVAGNDRPFAGTVKKEKTDKGLVYAFQVREPGDDKYDGEFTFSIAQNKMTGTWTAYKNIDIKHRKYTLTQSTFAYKPDILLEPAKEYINWNKAKETVETMEGGEEEEEMEFWMSKEFASATKLIYQVNASNKLLAKAEVENLKRGDLTIIRNTIYARHGYSFKNRPLRVFFDAQSWYIPVHSDIKQDFTEIEKTNIQLLLKYEKNAAEYYDYFGRG